MSTTRIVDLPENVSIQMPANASIGLGPGTGPGPSVANTRTDYDPQNPTYTPMNIHPNPYGNSLQPNVMPLPQPKYSGGMGGNVGYNPDVGQSSPGIDISDLVNMPPVRLPSRDIPMDQAGYQQDEEIQPNYVPKPKLTNDYVRDYEVAAEKSAKKQEKTKQKAEQIDDLMTEFQLPIMVIMLYFLFQIPLVNMLLYKYFAVFPFFHSDGNLNFYGILFKSVLFGIVFWAIFRGIMGSLNLFH